jgi:vancomycin resistance protein YoaR
MVQPVRSRRATDGGARRRGEPPRRRRPVAGTRLLAAAAGALLAIVGVAAALAIPADDDRAPSRVEVDGVAVGGLTDDEVRRALRHRAAELIGVPIVIARADGRGEPLRVAREGLGARPLIGRAVGEAMAPRGYGGRLLARLGLAPTRQVPLRWDLDGERLDRLVARIARDVNDPAPVPARLRVRGDDIALLPGREGFGVDVAALRGEIAGLPERVTLRPGPLPPPISDETAATARERALAIVAEPVEVTFQGRGVPIETDVLRRALRFRPRPPELHVALDPDVLYADIAPAFSARERPARDAAFRVSGAEVRLIPSRIGRRLDMPEIARLIAAAPASRQVRARFEVSRPGFTTAEARALRITEPVSEFTTSYPCCEPRVTNIRRAAEILDGQIIPAGATFSLNDALGPRTEDRGFVAAPQIAAGRLEDAVGGGVSQVATTIFNAAFFAGLELVTHTPHQFYISRYPAGREATVSFGGPELVFRNDWPAAVLISAQAGDTAITIRLFSTMLDRRVETETSEPTDYVEPEVKEVENPDLEPGEREVVQSMGGAGFTVTYTRRVYQGDRLRRDETFTWRYSPQHAFVEVGPPEEEPEEEEPGRTAPEARTAPETAPAPGRTTTAPAG